MLEIQGKKGSQFSNVAFTISKENFAKLNKFCEKNNLKKSPVVNKSIEIFLSIMNLSEEEQDSIVKKIKTKE